MSDESLVKIARWACITIVLVVASLATASERGCAHIETSKVEMAKLGYVEVFGRRLVFHEPMEQKP